MAKKTPKTPAKVQPELPPDVRPSDLERAKYPDHEDKAAYEAYWAHNRLMDSLGLPGGELTFYRSLQGGKASGQWLLTTLHISNPGRRSSAGAVARTYAVGLSDGKVYTTGGGPRETVRVLVKADNLGRLQKYLDLYAKGMEDAQAIRDRISSRRAQGQLYRAQGRSSWMW